MGAGYHGGFGKTTGNNKHQNSNNSKLPITRHPTFNTSDSKSVKTVSSYTSSNDAHKVPMTSNPNSVHISYKDGKTHSERYFDGEGNAYLDIDYSNHGNPKMHPVVPHEHTITIVNGNFIRNKKWRDIQK